MWSKLHKIAGILLKIKFNIAISNMNKMVRSQNIKQTIK